jgi:site-specific DNA recombinase
MIAAIYARRSDDQNERDEDAKSITRQVERARAYAERNGWTIDEANIFIDDGVRGAEFTRRHGYMRLLNAIKPRPPFSILIVSELSRLGREQFETGYAVKQIAQAGVRIVSYLEDREVQLKSATDKFLMAAVNFAAEVEREKARQRVTDAMTRNAARGYTCGGDCYGYRNVEVKSADGRRSHVDREIDETQASVVRRIFEMCAAGHGVKGIAKALNAERLPSPRPRKGRARSWTPSTVRAVLYRDLYRGISVWNKRRQTDAWGQRRTHRRPESEWIQVDVPHLRILSDDLWNAAHRRLTAASQTYLRSSQGNRWGRPASGVPSKYLLSGLLECAGCGGSMSVRSGTHGLGKRFFYICTSYNNRGQTVCSNGLRLPMTMTDDAILSKLSSYVLDPEIVEGAIADALIELRPSSAVMESRRGALQTEIRKLEEEQARFVAAIAIAGDVEALAQALRDRERRRTHLRSELVNLDLAEQFDAFDVRRIERELRKRLADWRELLRRQAPVARQVVSHLLDGRILCTPNKDERLYRFAGRVKFEQLLSGVVPTVGMVPVRGFEPRFDG